MTEIADLSAKALTARISAGEISPIEAVDAALARIGARAELNAVITVCAEEARRDAKAATEALAGGRAAGPLAGVPFTVKDLTPTAGVRTTMGSAIYEHFVPAEDAVAVARAKAAGAILIAKTTTPEFGHKPFGEAPIFGRTLNPVDPSVTCGGSSSGAAVAVAAGMGPIALGTDGGGSVRIPAACCGVVGFKATLGAVPHLQVPDLFGANAFVGPLARSVADARLLFDAIAGPDRRDPYGQVAPPPARRLKSLAGLRVAWLPRCGNRLHSEVERACTAAVRRFAELGAVVEEIALDFVALEPAFLVILESMLAMRVGPQLEPFRSRLDPSLIRTIEKGRGHSAVELQKAAAMRSECFRKVQDVLARFDLIVSPTLSAPPLPIGQDPHGPVSIEGVEAGTIRAAWYPYTYPFNLTGHPAISLPCGRTRGGLPIGLQIVGRWHEEAAVLDVAEMLEEELRL